MDNSDELEYFNNRNQFMKKLRSVNIDPYPHKYHVSTSLSDFKEKYTCLATGEVKDTVTLSIAGRIFECGHELNGLAYEIREEGIPLKFLVTVKYYESEAAFMQDKEIIHCGDIIGISGHPGKTNLGEVCMMAKKITLLSPCLRILPTLHCGLQNVESKFRQRYLDLIINNNMRKTFIIRSKVISYIRKFFDEMGFLEVETPVMDFVAGGASARPFTTYHNDMNMNVYLRVAPELPLKMLLVGGIDRVYEIGKQFRNEIFDAYHSPEFTSIECYMADADYEDMMIIYENLLSGLVKHIYGKLCIQYHPAGEDGPVYDIDFTLPFKRIHIFQYLANKLNATFPPLHLLHTEESRKKLEEICLENGVECLPPCTVGKLLEKLVSKFIEDICISPTFVCFHPEIMSPLAKRHRREKGLTERFDLIIAKKEIGDGNTDINNPAVQRKCFDDQLNQKAAGDEEAQMKDDNYCTALEYGLPPTGGLGIGIDRLVMLLTDKSNIKVGSFI